MTKKDAIQNVCNLALALLFLASTIVGYLPAPDCLGEYCFVSGMLIGLLFFASFIYFVRTKKHFAPWLYADCVVVTFVIFVATPMLKLQLQGAFWFIHIINPVLLFTYWVLFCNHNSVKSKSVIATAAVFPLCYVLFSKIMLIITGNCPFPARLILVGVPFGFTICAIIAVCAVYLILGYALHFANKALKVRK